MAKRNSERRKSKEDTVSISDLDSGEVFEIPDSLIEYDEETGRVCIGGKCMNVQYEPQTDDVVIEVAPNAKCSPLMKKVVNAFAKAMVDEKTRTKFRRKMVGQRSSNE